MDWKKIDKYDLVFRIMTYDHIPLDPGRKKNPKTKKGSQSRPVKIKIEKTIKYGQSHKKISREVS